MGLFGDCSDCTEKKKTISSLQNSNKQKDDTIKQKEISIKQNESTIKLIEDQLAQAKNEIATKQNQIKSQVSEIQELKTKIEELKKENDEYTKRISDLEVREANSVIIISDLKIKDDTKSKKILELLGNLQQKEEADNEKVNEISQLNEKMKRFEEAKKR
jgi:chromosome segregation ATPase